VLQSLPICLLLWLFLSVNLWLYKDCDPKISCDRIFSCIKIDKKRGITEKRIWVVDIFDACPSSALGPWCLHSSKLTCTDLCKIYSGAVSTVLAKTKLVFVGAANNVALVDLDKRCSIMAGRYVIHVCAADFGWNSFMPLIHLKLKTVMELSGSEKKEPLTGPRGEARQAK
jgi:hypothetical protein